MPKKTAPTSSRVPNRDAIKALNILLTTALDDRKKIRAEIDRDLAMAEHNNAIITTYQHRLQSLAPTETEAQAS